MKHTAVFDILCHERLPGMKHVAVFDILCHERLPGMKHTAVFDILCHESYLAWNTWQCLTYYVMKGYLAWNMWQCLTYYVMKGYLAWNMWQYFTIWHTGMKHVAVFHYLTHVIKGYLALKSRQSSLWLIWWKFTWHWTHGQAHWSAAGTDDCSSTWIQTETKTQ